VVALAKSKLLATWDKKNMFFIRRNCACSPLALPEMIAEAVARELFLDRGGQNRERQIDGFFIEFGPRFCPRNKRSL